MISWCASLGIRPSSAIVVSIPSGALSGDALSGVSTMQGGMHAEGSRARRQADLRSAAASCASVRIRAQSPFATASFGTTHEPPTHTTLGSAR